MNKFEALERAAPATIDFLSAALRNSEGWAQRFIAGESSVAVAASAMPKPALENVPGAALNELTHVHDGLRKAGLESVEWSGDGSFQAGLFKNGKALTRNRDGSVSLFDAVKSPPIAHGAPGTDEWLLYDSKAAGLELVNSVHVIREYRSRKYLEPWLKTFLPGINGADDTFLRRTIPPGSTPSGFGAARLAFATAESDIVVLGPTTFRAATPDMQFAKRRDVNQQLQVERVEPVKLGNITFQEENALTASVRQSGWELWDFEQTNAGRLPDGALKVIDIDAVKKAAGAIDSRVAIEKYIEGIKDATRRYGADSYPVAAFHSELGWHHKLVGNNQSAEEHLGSALKALERHEDWNTVERTSARLAVLFGDQGKHSLSREFITHSARAQDLLREWRHIHEY